MNKYKLKATITAHNITGLLHALEMCKLAIAEDDVPEYKARRVWTGNDNFSIDMTLKKPEVDDGDFTEEQIKGNEYWWKRKNETD